MTYHFHFQGLLRYVDLLVDGALATIQLTLAATLFGLAIGIACALLQTQGPRPTRRLVNSYVEIIRNTPLLVQCFFVFFGLPSVGIRMTAWQAALIALSFNFGAYVTEIIRAGIESIHPSQVEAAAALGLSRLQIFRYVILFPAVRNVYPSLTSQFVLLLLGSSIVSQISTKELFYTAAFIDSRAFLSFEVYAVITIIYLVLALGFRFLFAAVYAVVFRGPSESRALNA